MLLTGCIAENVEMKGRGQRKQRAIERERSIVRQKRFAKGYS